MAALGGVLLLASRNFCEPAACEQDEIAALDAVGDYEADATVMLKDVPQDIVIKTLKHGVMCFCVGVSNGVCARARVCVCRLCVRENLYLHFLNFCLCVRATGKAHRKQVREWMGGWSDQGL